MRKHLVLAAAVVAWLVGSVSAQQVYFPGNGVTPPSVVKEVHLMGPEAAMVGISCVVTEKGQIGDATVASSPNPRLNDVVLRALREWRFKPGMKDGNPVAVRIFVELSIVRQ